MGTKIYGISGSRALRSLWAIEETGIEYEHVKTSFAADSKQPDYLAINPNGRIPALVDGDLTLFESMAINLHLTKNHAPSLYPPDAADQARAIQWSVWAISEIEPLQMQIVIQKLFTPEDKRNPAVIESATKALVRPLKVLDQALTGSDYLLGDAFTVADLNVAGVMLIFNMIGFDASEFKQVSRWQTACYERPALARAQAL